MKDISHQNQNNMKTLTSYLAALNAPALTIKQFSALQASPFYGSVIYNSIDGTFEEFEF